MKKTENGEKTDVAKLFIVLMAISAVGFCVGAAYLYRNQSTCAGLVETETRSMNYIKKLAESDENKPYWGFESRGAGRTTGADLPSYLLRKANTHGVPIDKRSTKNDKHESKGYAQTKVNLRLSDVTLEQVVRYLYNVQQGKNDVFTTSLKLTNFDYNQPVPTCSATLDFTVFEELETKPK